MSLILEVDVAAAKILLKREPSSLYFCLKCGASTVRVFAEGSDRFLKAGRCAT